MWGQLQLRRRRRLSLKLQVSHIGAEGTRIVPPVVTVLVRNSSTATCFSAVYSAAKNHEPRLFSAP
jgi:hypothetical protein